MSIEKSQALEQARFLEKSGRWELAVERLVEAGFFDEAAKLLSGQKKYEEAARMLIANLGVPIESAFSLPVEGKRRAELAAICSAKANMFTEAVALFDALREYERAAQLLEKNGDLVGAARLRSKLGKGAASKADNQPLSAGMVSAAAAKKFEQEGKLNFALQAYVQLKQYGEAGRLAAAQGNLKQAAGLYVEAGMVFEAGMAYTKLEEGSQALEYFSRVQQSDPRYRAAAVEAIRWAVKLKAFGMKLDLFLSRFIESGPANATEETAFLTLGHAYEAHEMFENAKDVMGHVVEKNAHNSAARIALERLNKRAKPSAAQLEQLLKEEVDFQYGDGRAKSSVRPSAGLPGLPELPGLPALPRPSAPAAPVGPQPIAMMAPPSAPAGFPGGPGAGQMLPAMASDKTFSSTPQPMDVRAATLNLQPAQVVPGVVLQDRYRLEEKLGQGGMAVVFRAMDLELNQDIAVKLFTLPQDDEQALSRFRQEVQLARQISHPNIVRIFDMGVYKGLRFITMELIKGHELAKHMRQPIPLNRGVQWLIQACAGLQSAHDQGVVHRDIKPENLFINEQGHLKVMDFGIAKQVMAKGVTVAGMVAGTPKYMSPEQINNFTQVTQAADQYSLGIVAYEMLTGQAPFDHPELMPLLLMHLKDPPRPLRSINPNVPPRLEAVVLRLLSKKPEERYPSCKAAAEAMALALS